MSITPNIHTHVQVSSNGRIIIPAELRKSAHISDGDMLVMTLHDSGIIQIQSVQQSIKEAKLLIKEKFGNDDLISELATMRQKDCEKDA